MVSVPGPGFAPSGHRLATVADLRRWRGRHRTGTPLVRLVSLTFREHLARTHTCAHSQPNRDRHLIRAESESAKAGG